MARHASAKERLWRQLDAAVTTGPGTVPYGQRLAQYEAAKAAWTQQYPTATPREYEAAMRFLANRYGI